MNEEFILNVITVIIKATAPFITLWVMQMLFKFSIRTAILNHIIALAVAVYLQLLSIPTIGLLENMKANLVLAYSVSLIFFSLVFVVQKVLNKMCA